MEPPLGKRLLLILGAVLIQSIYTPTSLFMTGGIEPKLPIDVVPLWVVWVIPYTLCYPLWIFGTLWLTLRSDARLFRTAVAGLFFTFSVSMLIFLLFPTYVVHPDITGDDMLSKLLLSLMIAGGDYDACPSGHMYITTLLACFYSEWYPNYKWLWVSIVVIVIFATLFTKQHYILDVVGGLAIGWLGYRFGHWWDTMAGNFKRKDTSHVQP